MVKDLHRLPIRQTVPFYFMIDFAVSINLFVIPEVNGVLFFEI